MNIRVYKPVSGILLLALLTACTTTPLQIDSRYDFTEFEQVDYITRSSISGWQAIDSQSLIVETGPSRFYLLILNHPMRDLNYAESIAISATGNRIEAKFDCVEAIGPQCTGGDIPAAINRIYRLDDRESVSYAKDRIRGKTD